MITAAIYSSPQILYKVMRSALKSAGPQTPTPKVYQPRHLPLLTIMLDISSSWVFSKISSNLSSLASRAATPTTTPLDICPTTPSPSTAHLTSHLLEDNNLRIMVPLQAVTGQAPLLIPSMAPLDNMSLLLRVGVIGLLTSI